MNNALVVLIAIALLALVGVRSATFARLEALMPRARISDSPPIVRAHQWAASLRALVAAAPARRVAEAALPSVLLGVAAELRAGSSPAAALRSAATGAPPELGRVLATAAASVDIGASVGPALCATGLPGLRAFASCWDVTADTGAGLAVALDRLAGGLFDAQRVRTEVTAQLAGVQASAALLAALPVAGLAMGGALGARPLVFLLGRPAGRACLAAGLALELVGLCWTRRIVAGARARISP